MNEISEKLKIALIKKRLSLKDLASKTNIDIRTLQRRMLEPDKFLLYEIKAISEVLELDETMKIFFNLNNNLEKLISKNVNIQTEKIINLIKKGIINALENDESN